MTDNPNKFVNNNEFFFCKILYTQTSELDPWLAWRTLMTLNLNVQSRGRV